MASLIKWLLNIGSSASNYEWPRPTTFPPSPDTTSSVFPERPIRPLPKRRLRSRLSEEQAGSIIYPPAPPSSSPFGSPPSQLDRSAAQQQHSVNVAHDDHDHIHACSCGADHSDFDSDEEEEDKQGFNHRYSWPGRTSRHPRQFVEQVSIRNRAPLHESSTSSADGYESFENTNNKKKRKIPISGTVGSLPSESASLTVPTQSIDVSGSPGDALGQYYGSSSVTAGSGVGISGAGRGRFGRAGGRSVSDRRPLSTSTTSALNVSASGLASSNTQSDGIISAAIANAAEKGPVSPPKGQENVSLLQRQSKGHNNASNNFTFECKSEISTKMGLSARPVNPYMPGMTILDTQTSPKSAAHAQATRQQAATPQQAPLPKKTKPRRPGHVYSVAAQQRREQKAYENYHHPPRKEDVWICEFCEYESIFGKEPQALIKQYEIKDRKARKASEERRRLLEKAKAKARKNKKSSKNAKNAAQAGTQPGQAQRYDPQFDSMSPQDVDSQGEEYFDDGYDDGSYPADEDYHPGFSSPPPLAEPGQYNPKLTG